MTDGRAGIGLPGLDLQLDVTDDFLCHCCLLLEFKRLHVRGNCGTPPSLNEGMRGMGSGEWQAAGARSLFPIPFIPAPRPSPPDRTRARPALNDQKSVLPPAGGSSRS